MDPKLILYAALVAVLGMMFAYMIILSSGKKTTEQKDNDAPSKGKGHVAVDVKRNQNGVNISIYSVYDGGEPDGPIFPDILGDPEPDDGGLDRQFWDKVAMLDKIADGKEREEIISTLYKRGFVKDSDFSHIAMPAPDLSPEEREGPFPTDPAAEGHEDTEPVDEGISDEEFENLAFKG